MAAACLTVCATGEPGMDSPPHIIHHPIGIAVHPEGRYAAVVNSNFDLRYRNGTLVIVDLTAGRVVPEWTVPIPSFGGFATFDRSGTRIFVTGRGVLRESDGIEPHAANTLSVFEVDPDATPDSPFLYQRRMLDLAGDPLAVAVDADNRYVYVSHVANGEVSVVLNPPGRLVDGSASDRDDGMILRCVPAAWNCSGGESADGGCRPCTPAGGCGDGSCYAFAGDQARCVMPCLRDADCPDGFRCFDAALADPLLVDQRKFTQGANSLSISPLTGNLFVSSSQSAYLGVVRPYYVEGRDFSAFVETVLVAPAELAGQDARGLTFDDTGSRLYAAVRNRHETTVSTYQVPGVLVLDTTPGLDGREQNVLLDFIEVCDSPGGVAYDRGTLAVTCGATAELYFLDTASGEIERVVDLTPFVRWNERATPYGTALYSVSAGDRPVKRLLISAFEAHELLVIGLDGDERGRVLQVIETREYLD